MKLLRKPFTLVATLFLFSLVLTACGTSEQPETEIGNDNAATTDEKPIVTMTMESGEVIKLELYPEVAPNTVANFVSLIEQNYYDGLIFHRVIPGFMIQGGDPSGNGTGGPGYSIPGEFTGNGFTNDLSHTKGVLSMARTQDPNSAGSQFFIMAEDNPGLDGQYAAFGKVLEGIEVVETIVSVERDNMDKPLEDQKIKTMTVDTFGVDFGEPNKTE
jgi:peptidyl-prolyl cis-trans isomerase B (cyclophilin B)